MRAIWLSVFAVLLLIPLAALAVPTGLNIMPTADILATGQERVEYESNGSGKFYVPQGDLLYGTQTGFQGFEGGIDNATSKTSIYNLKWRLVKENVLLPSLAVGMQNVMMGQEPQSYAVVTKSIGPNGMLRASVGLMHITGETLTMIGAQGSMGPLVVKADTASGNILSRSAVSTGYTLGKGFTVTGILYHFDNAPNEKTVLLSYTSNIF